MLIRDQLDDIRANFAKQVTSEDQGIMDRAAIFLEKEFKEKKLLKVGDLAPEFILPTATGEPVTLSEKLLEGPAIVTFYRGGWCPFCNLELRTYQKFLSEIKEAGASLIAISPQTPDSSLSTAEKNALEFDVLSDFGSKVSEEYGLAFKLPKSLQEVYKKYGANLEDINGTDDWRLPVPGTFVIDRDARIVLSDIDTVYQNRLEPITAVEAVKRLQLS